MKVEEDRKTGGSNMKLHQLVIRRGQLLLIRNILFKKIDLHFGFGDKVLAPLLLSCMICLSVPMKESLLVDY